MAASKVSLILCTRNRAAQLPGALDAAFAAADAAPEVELEMVVVDNGSTDATQATLDEWEARTGRRLTRLSEPMPGVSRAKNLGIANARHNILAFTDDDCRLAPSYFRDLARHFGADDEILLRGGRVELGDSRDLPFTIKVDDEPAYYRPPAHPGGFVHGCNIAARRALFDRIGGFDASFGPGAPYVAAEDTELVWRASQAGIKVEYVPDMVTRHFHGRRDIRDIHDLQFQYEFGNGILLARHWKGGGLLRRHLWWNIRNGVREFLGARKFNPELGLSHWSLVRSNICGIAYYLYHELTSRPPSRR